MESLTTGRVAEVLTRLYREAEAADASLIEAFASSGGPEQMIERTLEQEAHDYRALYHSWEGNFLNVSRAFGQFIYACARAVNAQRIVEFGTSFGISTIHLACALRDSGGVRVVGTELEPTKAEQARRHVREAGLSDFVEIREGDALETLRGGVGGPIDLVMLDGAFTLYLPVLKLLEPHLKTGAIIVGENAVEGAGYLDYVRSPANGYLSQPVPLDPGRGNEFTVRMG